MADLNFLNTTNCDAITFNTPTTDLQYIQYVLGTVAKDVTNVDRYTLQYTINCCMPGTTINLAPRYQFTLSPACVFGTPTPGFDSYNITVGGINGDLVQSVALTVGGQPAQGWNHSVTNSVLSINAVQIAGTSIGAFNYILTINTNAGFTYRLAFTITKAGVNCDGTFGPTIITYPDLPDNVVPRPTVLPNPELGLNELIGMTTVLPGVYQLIMCEVNQDTTSNCIQSHMFIDCGTLRCQVVNKLVMCIDSNIMDYYNALIWGNDCNDVVTYIEMCALYEILTVILETTGCYGRIDECNCTDAPTIANKLHPIPFPSNNNLNNNNYPNNGCNSC